MKCPVYGAAPDESGLADVEALLSPVDGAQFRSVATLSPRGWQKARVLASIPDRT
jgi:hypothetical protein